MFVYETFNWTKSPSFGTFSKTSSRKQLSKKPCWTLAFNLWIYWFGILFLNLNFLFHFIPDRSDFLLKIPADISGFCMCTFLCHYHILHFQLPVSLSTLSNIENIFFIWSFIWIFWLEVLFVNVKESVFRLDEVMSCDKMETSVIPIRMRRFSAGSPKKADLLIKANCI